MNDHEVIPRQLRDYPLTPGRRSGSITSSDRSHRIGGQCPLEVAGHRVGGWTRLCVPHDAQWPHMRREGRPNATPSIAITPQPRGQSSRGQYPAACRTSSDTEEQAYQVGGAVDSDKAQRTKRGDEPIIFQTQFRTRNLADDAAATQWPLLKDIR